MSSRKASSKAASKTAVAPSALEAPKPTAASREKDKEEAVPEYRVDLGEALPTPPIKTATDNE